MKILFDWIHRKLHPAAVAKYSQVPRRKEEEDEKMKGSSMVVVEENEALLLNDMLHGILAIGTLGQYEDPFLLDPSCDAPKLEQEEEEEEITLVKEAAPVVKPVQLMNKKEEGQKEKDRKVETTLAEIELKLLREDWPLLREDKEKGERKRMTLAELFAADPMTKEEQGIDKGSKNSGGKQLHEVKKKKTHDTTVKSCTNSGSNSNIKKINNKLQKLTTRMLKKKIHPESINMAREADVHRSSALVY